MITKIKRFEARPRTWVGMLSVIVALGTPVVQKLLGNWFEANFVFPVNRFVSLWVFWISVIIVLGLARYMEGFSLAVFGFEKSHKPLRSRLLEWIVAVLAAMVVTGVVITFSEFVREQIGGEPTQTLELVRMLPAWVLIPAWITGSFTEEVLFRSYPIERLTQITGKRWLAGTITIIAFTVLHLLSWDWIHVLTVVLPASIIITLLYMWKRSLAFVVIIHAVINAPLLLLPIIEPYL